MSGLSVVLGLALAAAVVVAVRLFLRSRRLDQSLSESQQRSQRIEAEFVALKRAADPLWQYQHVHDAFQEASRIRAEADAHVSGVRAGLERFKSELDAEVASLRREEEALQGRVLAIRNAIEGYGDEYLLPVETVLDELAEDFSHKEAGQKLKEARARSHKMVSSGQAADCDYKEKKRRGMSIHFVLDAFNGKVDAILAKVKHDNFGKLQQEIQDAYRLVNHHGTAFKDARITEPFLAARLDELRWAVAAHELRLQEKEEQRIIKEQMREEEKARREYEKALKEAEKEERALEKAMAKARKEMEGATEEQRLQYEARLAELQAKLQEAESKHERATSMAQLTRRGHVYVISNVGSFGGDIYKIGLTRRLEPLDRVKELGDASVPFQFDVHALIYSEDAPALEAALHRHFETRRVNKVNLRKEFFSVDLQDIRDVVEQHGLDVHFTMAAEAREYRESVAAAKRQGEAPVAFAEVELA